MLFYPLTGYIKFNIRKNLYFFIYYLKRIYFLNISIDTNKFIRWIFK